MNVTAWIKQRTSTNFRQILKIEKVEFCSGYKNMKSISWLEDILIFANKTFPQFVHDCPYRGVIDSTLNCFDCNASNSFQTVKIVNGAFNRNGKLDNFYFTRGPKVIGNGIVKIRIAIYDDIDTKILLFDSYHESSHRDVELSGSIL
jgi:hypothetical protein